MLSFKFKKDTPLNILCLGAHCDDIELGTGGTLLKLIQENKIGQVNWIVFSSDETRRTEAISSANQVLENVTNKKITVNSFRDGFLKAKSTEIKEYFEKIKSIIKPDIIFTHYRNDRHQDHRIISDLTWNTWRNHMILEYEIPKYDGDLGIPNLYVPLEKKILAKRNKIMLDNFVSQREKHWFDEETLNALPRLRGIESATTFAEAFYAHKLIL
ncbi:PIG-L family deacetylase [Prolixibacteraceae bacterium Z1-6]|uniref:PIG-L family deacetylase n=1 Tax=Draconibacterium aestuarii TaxID=2998507 RepID=A0A9X3F9U2_9BACT|nr:PIG-L family deacetylase [Prolixibacteraceae bacterium Z1-6]